MMWVVKVGEKEESYSYESLSSHLRIEVVAEAGVVVIRI